MDERLESKPCIGSPHNGTITYGSHTWDEVSIETQECYKKSLKKVLLPILKEMFQKASASRIIVFCSFERWHCCLVRVIVLTYVY